MIHSGKLKRMEIFHNTNGETPEAIKARTGCTTIINGVFFNPDGSLCGDIRKDGKWIAKEGNTVNGIGWSAKSEPVLTKTADATKYDNFLTCGTVQESLKLRRAAIGFLGQTYTVLAESSMTIQTVKAKMEEKCAFYLDLDGGGSVFLSCPDGTVDTTLDRKKQNRMYLLIWEDEDGGATKKMKICLDPGHGLAEAYNQSPDGSYHEYEFALDMANRVRTHLLRNGHEVLLTREDGSTPSLAERAAKANAWGADLYVSKHSNAVLINAISDPDGDGYGDAEGLTVWTVAAGGERERAARLLLEEMRDAGVKLFGSELYTAGFAVLKWTTMPAYLIEYAFHNTKSDIALLKSSAHRAKLAEATAKAIVEWCGTDWIAEPVAVVPSESATESYFALQFGAFVEEDNAEAMKKVLAAEGYETIIKEVKK